MGVATVRLIARRMGSRGTNRAARIGRAERRARPAAPLAGQSRVLLHRRADDGRGGSARYQRDETEGALGGSAVLLAKPLRPQERETPRTSTSRTSRSAPAARPGPWPATAASRAHGWRPRRPTG